MKNIVLINVYFGSFPWYFNHFLHSCGYNPQITFLIFTDNDETISTPSNVRLIKFSIEDFSSLASKKLSLKINISKGYKLCDFKPAYGMIFSDFITEFDYWGMTDIDVIFGKISDFITPSLLEDFDVISVRHDYPTGFFMIFRNIDHVNSLFFKSKDVEQVFLSDRHFCFDECNFKHYILEHGHNLEDIQTEIESFYHILIKESKNGRIRVHWDFFVIEGLPGKMCWDRGVLTYQETYEALLYHLISYKSHRFTRKIKWQTVPERFYISKYSFSTSSISSLIHLFFYEKVSVNLLKVINRLDHFLSIFLLRSKLKHLNQGVYVEGDFQITVCQNHIIMYGQKFERLYRSFLYKGRFYIYGIKGSSFKFDGDDLLKLMHVGDCHKMSKLEEK